MQKSSTTAPTLQSQPTKCSNCRQSLASHAFNANTVFLCQDCFDKRIMCDGGCDTLLTVNNSTRVFVKYGVFPYSQLKMCSTCQKAPIPCGSCTAPAARTKEEDGLFPGTRRLIVGGKIIDDYRCAFCIVDTINSTNDTKAQEAFKMVANWVYGGSGFGLKLTGQLKMSLSTLGNLKEISGHKWLDGHCSKPGNGIHLIHIADYLRPVRFIKIAAHEMTHAWQHEQPSWQIEESKLDQQSAQIKEGFAEWVADKFLDAYCKVTKQDDSFKQEIKRWQDIMRVNNPSKTYREGLNYFLKLEQGNGAKGVDAVLAAARSPNQQ